MGNDLSFKDNISQTSLNAHFIGSIWMNYSLNETLGWPLACLV